MGGDSPGYVESEFPIYSYLLGVIFQFSGISELAGRLMSICFSLISIVVFYFLVSEIADKNTALWSSLFMAILPLNVFMGRTIMPESLLLLSLISGVYLFSKWLSSRQMRYLIAATFFITLACLIKIPSLYIGLPLLYLAWVKYGKRVFAQWDLWAFGMFVIVTTATWYYHAHQIFLQSGLTFGVWEYGTDKWGNWSLVSTWDFWKTIFIDHLGTMVFAGIGYPIFAIGLLSKRSTSMEAVIDYWLAGVLVYFLIVSRGNYVHDYYQLPFTIPAAYFLGKVYAKFLNPEKTVIFSLLITCFLGIAAISAYNYKHIYMNSEDPKKSEVYELSQLIKHYTEENSLIIAVDNNDPTMLYLSNRKGWHMGSGSDWENREFLYEKINNGASYLAGRLQSCHNELQCTQLDKILNEFQIVFKDRDYFIVRFSN